MQLSQIRKALVPLLVAGVLAILATVGVGENMTVADAVTFLITAGLVWAVPNKA